MPERLTIRQHGKYADTVWVVLDGSKWVAEFRNLGEAEEYVELVGQAPRLRAVETAARKVCRYYEKVDKDRMSPSLAGLIEHLADVLGEGERTRDGSEHRPG